MRIHEDIPENNLLGAPISVSKTKRNETKRNETKRNETKRNETKRNETKRNKTKQKTNEDSSSAADCTAVGHALSLPLPVLCHTPDLFWQWWVGLPDQSH